MRRDSNVLPRTARENIKDGALFHSVFTGELLRPDSIGMRYSDLGNLESNKFMGGIQFSFFGAVAVSMFIKHVINIVSRCAKKQMRRIHAWGVIAFVKNLHSRRNRAVMYDPRHPVSCEGFTVSKPRYSISIGMAGRRPNPASFGLDNIRPESFGESLLSSLVKAISTTILCIWKVRRTEHAMAS